MRNEKYIQSEIDRARAGMERSSDEKLGFLLYSLQLLGCKDTIKVGHFNFHANKHDTGVSVRVYIENNGETFDVINGTYWYSHDQFGHNKFTHVKGAWDSAFDSAVSSLRDKAKGLYLNKIERLNEEMDSVKNLHHEKKKRFEALF